MPDTHPAPDRATLARYTRNLERERDAVVLYDSLAASEPNPAVAGIYRQLAGTERRHAAIWEGRLTDAGGTVPPVRTGLQTRFLNWLGRRFGAAVVLPVVTRMERHAGAEYAGQPEAEVPNMIGEERAHARVFQMLVQNNRGVEGETIARLEGRHRSTGGNALRAGVLGANDGLVSNFSLIMGVAGAEMGAAASNPHLVLITGLAGLLAGATSMALGEWLSVQSSRELFGHQLAVEKDELQGDPESEREELALIYQAKGLPAAEATALAARLLADPKTALDTLAREELGINPDELGGSAWEAAITSFLLFAAGAILPVIPFFFLTGARAIVLSALLGMAGLFTIGAAITLVTGRNPWFSGLRMVVFGLAAAALTFGIGHLIGANLGG